MNVLSAISVFAKVKPVGLSPKKLARVGSFVSTPIAKKSAVTSVAASPGVLAVSVKLPEMSVAPVRPRLGTSPVRVKSPPPAQTQPGRAFLGVGAGREAQEAVHTGQGGAGVRRGVLAHDVDERDVGPDQGTARAIVGHASTRATRRGVEHQRRDGEGGTGQEQQSCQDSKGLVLHWVLPVSKSFTGPRECGARDPGGAIRVPAWKSASTQRAGAGPRRKCQVRRQATTATRRPRTTATRGPHARRRSSPACIPCIPCKGVFGDLARNSAITQGLMHSMHSMQSWRGIPTFPGDIRAASLSTDPVDRLLP